MDRSRCLDILKVYGLSPRDLRLLHRYCEQLQMVAQAGFHYVEPFRGYRGITQEDILFTTIFNVVVYVLVSHYESLV